MQVSENMTADNAVEKRRYMYYLKQKIQIDKTYEHDFDRYIVDRHQYHLSFIRVEDHIIHVLMQILLMSSLYFKPLT